MSETVTIEQVLQEVHPELPSDDNTYRLFKLNETFSFDNLTERDLENHKRLNGFGDKDKLVVVQNSQIIYAEE